MRIRPIPPGTALRSRGVGCRPDALASARAPRGGHARRAGRPRGCARRVRTRVVAPPPPPRLRPPRATSSTTHSSWTPTSSTLRDHLADSGDPSRGRGAARRRPGRRASSGRRSCTRFRRGLVYVARRFGPTRRWRPRSRSSSTRATPSCSTSSSSDPLFAAAFALVALLLARRPDLPTPARRRAGSRRRGCSSSFARSPRSSWCSCSCRSAAPGLAPAGRPPRRSPWRRFSRSSPRRSTTRSG